MAITIYEDQLDLEKRQVTVSTWEINKYGLNEGEDKSAVLVFGVDERDIVVPSHFELTRNVMIDGVKVNIEAASNGWVFRSGKVTRVLTNHYGIERVIKEFTTEEKTYEIEIGDTLNGIDLSSILLKLNTHYKAQQKRAELAEAA